MRIEEWQVWGRVQGVGLMGYVNFRPMEYYGPSARNVDAIITGNETTPIVEKTVGFFVPL